MTTKQNIKHKKAQNGNKHCKKHTIAYSRRKKLERTNGLRLMSRVETTEQNDNRKQVLERQTWLRSRELTQGDPKNKLNSNKIH